MQTTKKIPMYIAVLLESGGSQSEGRRSIWLPLPATKVQFDAAIKRIGGERGNFVIRDYAAKVPKVSVAMLMGVPLSVANYLAARLNKLYDDEIVKLCAICDTDYYFDRIGQLIDYTYAPYDYTLLPDVMDEEDLGAYHLDGKNPLIADAKMRKCVDLPPRRYADARRAALRSNVVSRSFGRNLAEQEQGVFTPHSYLTSKTGWSYKFKDRVVPEYWNLKGYIGEDLYGDWSEDTDYGEPLKRPEMRV